MSSKSRRIVRSAKTGRFVPKGQATRSPSTTVTETVKTSRKRKKS